MSSAVAFDALRASTGARRAARGALTRHDVRLVPTTAGVMRVRDSGDDGGRPAVVLACDPPNVVEHYDALVGLLAERYRVICCEMPGFGFSRPARGFGFTLPEYERVTEQLLDGLHVTEAVLGFPCIWGYVAVRLAVRRPDLVRGLVLAQAPHWSEEIAWARRLDPSRLIGRPYVGQLLMAVSAGRVARGWYQVALPPGTPATTTAGFTDPAVRALRSGGLFCLASLTQAWFGPATTELMHDPVPATQPAVLLWGQADRSHRRSHPESALPYLPDGQVLTYPDAGHFPELEQPMRFREALALLDRA
ncbi:MAG TPA: alpha/beta hydrolase [Pseudonocardia sp.]|nr:alpha/beta hydrolase [Pseudonocardia sp.]